MTIKRNDPCPCGSGKKYKTCCFEKDRLSQTTHQMNTKGEEVLNYFICGKIGIRPRLVDRFYVQELVQFFKTTLSEADATEKKEDIVSHSLSLFVDYLEHERITTWEACDEDFWKKLFAFSQLDLAYEQSEEKTKAFFQTMLELARWLDATYQIEKLAAVVESLVNHLEEDVLKAIRFLDVYHENVDNPFLTGYSELRRETLIQEAGETRTQEGVFEVQEKSGDGVTCQSLLTRMIYQIQLPQEIREAAPNGTTFIGLIKEVRPNEWDILALDRVFPPAANAYLRRAIGVLG